MFVKRLALIILSFYLVVTTLVEGASIFQKVPYSFVGNYEGLLTIPQKSLNHRLPAILYVYDEYYDWVGPDVAKTFGYDLSFIAKAFASKGYVTMIPLDRNQQVNSLTGALLYLKKHPQVDPNQIHVIAQSEGAFLALLALKEATPVASMTLISPILINDTKYYSLSSLFRQVEILDVPLFIVYPDGDQLWRRRSSERIYQVLSQFKVNIIQKHYPEPKRWFWDIQNYYVRDIFDFIDEPKQQIEEDVPESSGNSPQIG